MKSSFAAFTSGWAAFMSVTFFIVAAMLPALVDIEGVICMVLIAILFALWAILLAVWERT